VDEAIRRALPDEQAAHLPSDAMRARLQSVGTEHHAPAFA
jgi:hypothetical protein